MNLIELANEHLENPWDISKFSGVKKYALTKHKITSNGIILTQIFACKSFSKVNAGELGGYIENEKNLSQEGTCWIHDRSKVYGNARVIENAQVKNDSKVLGTAIIRGNSLITNRSKVDNGVFINETIGIKKW